MAAFVEGVAHSQIVKVEIQLDGQTSELFMVAGEMREHTQQALYAIEESAVEMLNGRSYIRFTYNDDEGDACTLTAGSVPDALNFTTVGENHVCVLKVAVLVDAQPLVETPPDSEEEPVPAPAELPIAAEPPSPAPTPAEAPVEAPAFEAQAVGQRNLEVHLTVACDGCDQQPILGKRFKCLECHDYDLCERCFKRNRVDMSVHEHNQWARIQADSHVSVRGDVESAELVTYYERSSPEAAPVHIGVACDVCEAAPIAGSRFKCLTVPNYDLCPACYAHRAEVCPHGDQPFEELGVAPVVCGPAPEPVLEIEPTVEAPAESPVQEEPERLPSPSAAEGSSALKSLAFNLGDDLCLLALEALMKHPDERLSVAAIAAAVAASTAEPAAPELEARAEPEAEAEDELKPEDVEMVVEEEKAPADKISAKVLSSSQLVLGVEAAEDEIARGDATDEFQEMLHEVPSAHQAYRCGRMVIPTSSDTASVPAEAKVIVVNDGNVPWPEASCLSVVAGDAFGLVNMGLGPMQPGEAAEVILDLDVPQQAEPGLARSVWSMTDATTGASFGPLILFEVAWMQV